MKKNILNLCSLIGLTILGVFSCQNIEPNDISTLARPQLPAQTHDYAGVEFPEHFSFLNVQNSMEPGFFPNSGVVNPSNPAVTNHGATLGRVLFYDPQLSINNSVSCGSCHHQSKAFADGLQGSVGFGGKVTPRNSMAIVNPTINRNLFWDSRVQSLPDLILEPIQNHVEMGMEDLDILTKKLSATDYYPELFKKAYGSEMVNSNRIADAMAQFLSSIKSTNSKFDEGATNDFRNYSNMEQLGKDLFFSERAQCSGCHAGANFSAPDFPGGEYGGDSFGSGTGDVRGTTNIGLDFVSDDNGLSAGRFRIPTLRNIALTAPYMHDGRFETLDEVIEHYDSGVKAHPQLDPKFISDDGSPVKLSLTTLEKRAMIAFLHTLTDEQFINESMYSDPFKK